MLKFKAKALRLSIQFATLGGLSGIVVFLNQGEFTKAFWCAVTAGLCILVLALAILLADSFKR